MITRRRLESLAIKMRAMRRSVVPDSATIEREPGFWPRYTVVWLQIEDSVHVQRRCTCLGGIRSARRVRDFIEALAEATS